MGRKNKSTLNQNIFNFKKEPIIEEPIIEDISLKVSGEKIVKAIKKKELDDIIHNEESNDINEDVTPRDLSSLSKAELRFYQRTGLIPK